MTTPEEIDAHGLRVRIDRPQGAIIEGTSADGKPYRVVQQVPYGYLPGVLGDDGEPYDVYVGTHGGFERVYIVTQCRAANGHYDEQKALWGFASQADAEGCYRAHTASVMFGRIGSLSRATFLEQLEAWRAAPAGPFRAVTDEDAAELAEMDELEGDLDDEEPESIDEAA